MVQKVPPLPHQELYNTEDFLLKVNCTLIRISATGAEAVVIFEGDKHFTSLGTLGNPNKWTMMWVMPSKFSSCLPLITTN